MNDRITHKEMYSEIRRAVRDELAPLKGEVDGHHNTLYGADGRNGLVGDVNRIKFLGKLAAFFGGIGALLLAGLKWVWSLKGGGG